MGHLYFPFETVHVDAHPYNEHYKEQLENDATSNVQSLHIYICIYIYLCTHIHICSLIYSFHFVFNIAIKNKN